MEKITGVMYGKFNANDKRRRIIIANKKKVYVVDKPFKDVLAEEVDKLADKQPTTDSHDSMDELWIWGPAFDRRNRKKRGVK